MSLKKTNDGRGSYRGAGSASRDYASFDRSCTEYPGRDIYAKVEGVGDYEDGATFTGEVSRKNSSSQQWPRLADRQNTKGDGAYSSSGRRNTERPRAQSDGKAVGGQKVSD